MKILNISEEKIRGIVEDAARKVLKEVLLNRTPVTVPTDRYGDIDIDIEIGDLGGFPMVRNWEFSDEDWVLGNVMDVGRLQDEINGWILDNEDELIGGE